MRVRLIGSPGGALVVGVMVFAPRVPALAETFCRGKTLEIIVSTMTQALIR
jgi:hypothetical protein